MKEELKNIIDKINVTFKESNDKSDLITPQHRKYICEIANDKGGYLFTYQCNPNYTRPTKDGLIACVLNDARCYQDCLIGEKEDNMQEFANMFGYDDLKTLIKTFKGCKEASDKIGKMLTRQEQEDLYNYYCEKGEI